MWNALANPLISNYFARNTLGRSPRSFVLRASPFPIRRSRTRWRCVSPTASMTSCSWTGMRQAYETLAHRSWNLPWVFRSYSADLGSLAELQVDNATLFEGVNNTLKLFGDQYLGRVYRMVNRRFHLDEWDSSILRKLQSLESIYDKISHQVSERRTAMLEWIIILLIAFSIAVGFIH